MDIKNTNDNLIKFWDSAITLTKEDKEQLKEVKDLDCSSLAPSEKLYNAVQSLKDCKHILDYGCGNGWASIIATKSGCPHVTAVDVIPNGVEATKAYAEAFGVDKQIMPMLVSTSWISKARDESFDGLVCSNVLDVVPLETSKEIIKETARMLTKGAKAIIGLNFYFPKEALQARNMELVDDKYLFMNNVLRLTNLSDDEWKELLSPYYEIEKLEYFAWPGESKETRRLFHLRKL